MTDFLSGYTKITGVIGHNIHYTKSPLIHNYWYQFYKIDGVYVCFQSEPDNFERAVQGLFDAGVVGLNVTVPFKERAFQLSDNVTDEACSAEAVNCLLYRDKKIIGHNTDGIGFYNALRHLDKNLDLNDKTILIIGAGGAAASIINFLSRFSVHIIILNRTYSKAYSLVEKFSAKVSIMATDIPCKADIIIQTTNVKKIEIGNILDIADDIIAHASYIMDINYGKEAGAFLEKAQLLNIKHCDGLEMLLQQAAPSFELFNNVKPEITYNIRNIL